MIPAGTIAVSNATMLREKIENRTAVIGIVGLGYVGLPLAKAILDAGYPVLGYDIDQRKIDALAAGRSYIEHLGPDFFKGLAANDKFDATANAAELAKADAILLCVPTPLGQHREPDLTYVLESTKMVAKVLRKGQLVVLESTTYPGTTRDEMLPILEASGLRSGEDFFLAYSPEREDPGSPGRSAAQIPKLVGGTDATSGDLAEAFYTRVVAKVHRVSSAEVAESAKLLENIYRAVNIALVNEMKTVMTALGVDVWEVIDAAATKPFGFQAFYPGPGLGGHCIPIDPFYLTWKAREYGRVTRFIELAGEVNTSMPHYVVDRVANAMNDQSKAMKGSRVLVVGLAYKADIDDVRESPSFELIELCRDRGAEVDYYDPFVAETRAVRKYDLRLASVKWGAATIASYDCVLISTAHSGVDYSVVAKHAKLCVDTRDAMRAFEAEMGARLVRA